MWIKWKYNDHGHPDYERLEIPDDLEGCSSVEEYLCEAGLVPTWSERFYAGRIKWHKSKPNKEVILKKLHSVKGSAKFYNSEVKRLKKLLTTV